MSDVNRTQCFAQCSIPSLGDNVLLRRDSGRLRGSLPCQCGWLMIGRTLGSQHAVLTGQGDRLCGMGGAVPAEDTGVLVGMRPSGGRWSRLTLWLWYSCIQPPTAQSAVGGTEMGPTPPSAPSASAAPACSSAPAAALHHHPPRSHRPATPAKNAPPPCDSAAR